MLEHAQNFAFASVNLSQPTSHFSSYFVSPIQLGRGMVGPPTPSAFLDLQKFAFPPDHNESGVQCAVGSVMSPTCAVGIWIHLQSQSSELQTHSSHPPEQISGLQALICTMPQGRATDRALPYKRLPKISCPGSSGTKGLFKFIQRALQEG